MNSLISWGNNTGIAEVAGIRRTLDGILMARPFEPGKKRCRRPDARFRRKRPPFDPAQGKARADLFRCTTGHPIAK